MTMLRLFVSAFFSVGLVCPAFAQLGDVTYSMAVLGNPTQAQYPDNTVKVFYRNVWALQAFHSRIYVGNGDSSSNERNGADNIAGPTTIWSYDPTSNAFLAELSVQDEEISNFRIYSNYLFAPGIDTKTGLGVGSFYVKFPPWYNFDTIPSFNHTRDIMVLPPGILGVLGASPDISGRSSMQISNDGYAWRNVTCDGLACPSSSMLRFVPWTDGHMYVTSTRGLLRYDPIAENLISQSDSVNSTMIPGGYRAIMQDVDFAGGKAYIAGRYTTDDIHFEGVYLMYSTAWGVAQTVAVPQGGVPRGLLVLNGTLHVLYDAGGYSVVATTTDLLTWTYLLWFTTTPTSIARSFEYLDGYLYFGLGCYPTALSNISGQIRRVAYTP